MTNNDSPLGTGFEGSGGVGSTNPVDASPDFIQHPGYSHALGCGFNGMPCIACVCGLPNKPEVKP